MPCVKFNLPSVLGTRYFGLSKGPCCFLYFSQPQKMPNRRSCSADSFGAGRQSLAQSAKNSGHGHDTISCPKPSSQKKSTSHKFQEYDIVCSRITDRFSSTLSWMYDYAPLRFQHKETCSQSHMQE